MTRVDSFIWLVRLLVCCGHKCLLSVRNTCLGFDTDTAVVLVVVAGSLVRLFVLPYDSTSLTGDISKAN